MSESELVARLRAHFPHAGDDAAIIGSQLFTTDLLIEDIDFVRSIPMELIMRKSIAVNVSDLAAMGARPQYALVGLGLPPWVDAPAAIDHLAAAARHHGIEVIGGDLSRSDKLMISVTAIGTSERPLLRSGAKPGDRIFVSRPIGASAAGLQLLMNGWSVDGNGPSNVGYATRELVTSIIRRHVDPEPETRLGIALSGIAEVTSCIDISDGLSTDLHHLCDASGLGAEIEKERLPVFPDLLASAAELGLRPQECVLNGGEEYALLFTASLTESVLSGRVGRPVYAIGRMSREPGVRINGVSLAPGGFDHFV